MGNNKYTLDTPVVVCNTWYYHLQWLTGGACVNGHMWHYDILLFRGKNSSISYREKQEFNMVCSFGYHKKNADTYKQYLCAAILYIWLDHSFIQFSA